MIQHSASSCRPWCYTPTMFSDLTGELWHDPVPLFPLPGMVLLPRAVAALHIFEPRYRAMTRDAAAGRGQIAMALPLAETGDPGAGPVRPIVCVGRIIRLEPMSDGRFNLLLQGVARAQIISELHDRPYRRAALRVPQGPTAFEQEMLLERETLIERINSTRLAFLPNLNVVKDLLIEPAGLSDAVDVLASHSIAHLGLSQQLLLETSLQRRVMLIIEVLDALVDPNAAGLDDLDFDPSTN